MSGYCVPTAPHTHEIRNAADADRGEGCGGKGVRKEEDQKHKMISGGGGPADAESDEAVRGGKNCVGSAIACEFVMVL